MTEARLTQLLDQAYDSITRRGLDDATPNAAFRDDETGR